MQSADVAAAAAAAAASLPALPMLPGGALPSPIGTVQSALDMQSYFAMMQSPSAFQTMAAYAAYPGAAGVGSNAAAAVAAAQSAAAAEAKRNLNDERYEQTRVTSYKRPDCSA